MKDIRNKCNLKLEALISKFNDIQVADVDRCCFVICDAADMHKQRVWGFINSERSHTYSHVKNNVLTGLYGAMWKTTSMLIFHKKLRAYIAENCFLSNAKTEVWQFAGLDKLDVC